MFRFFVFFLLINALLSTSTFASNDDSLQERVRALETELQALRQQLAQQSGAAAVVSDVGAATAPAVYQPFVPSTANTRRTLATRTSLWPNHWSFLSAVSADSRVTVTHVMTDRLAGGGNAACVVLGDQHGWLYFFNSQGHLLYEYDTGGGCPVTALASQLVRSNTTHLAVGLQDGTLLLLATGHDSFRSSDGGSISSITPIMNSTAADRAQQLNSSTTGSQQQQPLRHLMFTKSKQRKLLLLVDASGQLVLLVPPVGRVLLSRELQAAPLAVNLNTDYQMVVQTSHAAYIVLMHRGRTRIARPCAGLTQPAGAAANSACSPDSLSGQPDVLVAAAFDPIKSYRVFGVTRGGELVALVVPSAQKTNLCKVVQRVPLGLPPGPVRLVASKNRLVLLHAAGVATFNISNPLTLAGSHIVSHTWQDMWRLYGLDQQQQRQIQEHSEVQSEDRSVSRDDAASVTGSSDDGSSSSQGVLLHSAAWDSNLLPAAVIANVLLLPVGDKGVAAFATTGAAVGAGAGAGALGWGSEGSSVDWVKVLQPFVVVMMVVIGVWQFVRASNKHGMGQNMRGMGSGYSGLEGLNPEDLGQLGMGQGLFGSSGGFGSGLDRDFGPYAGPRGNRESIFDSYGGLNAVSARRRARAVMHGRPERGERGLSGPRGSTAAGQQGFARAMAGGRAAAAAAAGPAGVSGAAAAGAPSARRVRFSEEAGEDSGGDDIGRVLLPSPSPSPAMNGQNREVGEIYSDEERVGGVDLVQGGPAESAAAADAMAMQEAAGQGDWEPDVLMQQAAALAAAAAAGQED